MKILSKVKEEMEFNQGLQSLVETLKSIAVSQFHSLESKTKTFAEFYEVAEDFFTAIASKDISSPFINSNNESKLVVAVTSDKGLLGGLNKQVMTAALDKINQPHDKLIIIGNRGRIFTQEYNISSTVFPGIKDNQRYSQAMQLRSYLIKELLQSKINGLMVVYPEAESLTTQQVKIKTVIPYQPIFEKNNQSKDSGSAGFIWESHPYDLIEYLIYLIIGQLIYDIFGVSRLAELSARFTHLEESSQKLTDKNKGLKREYFYIRHEIIDKSMRELFSARSLLK